MCIIQLSLDFLKIKSIKNKLNLNDFHEHLNKIRLLIKKGVIIFAQDSFFFFNIKCKLLHYLCIIIKVRVYLHTRLKKNIYSTHYVVTHKIDKMYYLDNSLNKLYD